MSSLGYIETSLSSIADKCNSAVPPFFDECLDFMIAHADVEGIFRVPGSVSEINRARLLIDSTGNFPIREASPYLVANIITLFIRKIPDHILIDSNIEKWENVEPQDLEKIKANIQELPTINLILLSRFLGFFVIISQHSAKNKMGTFNLATILSPILIAKPKDPSWFLNRDVVITMLENYQAIFGDKSTFDENGAFLPSQTFKDKVGNIWDSIFCQTLSPAQRTIEEPPKTIQQKMCRGIEIPEIDFQTLLTELLEDSIAKNAAKQLTPI